MDKQLNYAQIIKDILKEYSLNKPINESLEIETIFDDDRGHYQIIVLGWEKEKYVHFCLIHLDLKLDKIWIQWNSTDLDIAESLVSYGVSRQDIVIAFHPLKMRKLTGYAVG